MLSDHPPRAGFPGSYAADDVAFLLKPVEMEPTPTEEKERLIQSGRCHYSEMLPVERVPDTRYLALFHQALRANGERLARDIVRVAAALAAARPSGEIVLVSLARAGTPAGVLLRRTLTRMGRRSPHYSISIIRGRGIDARALDHVRARHDERGIVFVDGWTGKGAIAGELRHSVAAYNAANGVRVPATLAVLADLCGSADLAATGEDYLVPSALLNAVVSGLVSRSVLHPALVGTGDFHACRFYGELRRWDLSRAFVERIDRRAARVLRSERPEPTRWTAERRRILAEHSAEFVDWAQRTFQLTDPNRVKPGIGEATRALLRRVPERLLLRTPDSPDVRHLVHLAREARVPVEVHPRLPYRAAVIIRTLGE